MPLFRRPDGDLIPAVTPERRIMPLIMPGRNGSAVYHEATYDVTLARKWLRKYNRSEPKQPATMFHLFLWACAYGIRNRSAMNRFVSGSRIYQRKKVEVAFAVKKTFERDAPLATVKMDFSEEGEALESVADRIAAAVRDGRSDGVRVIDKELAFSAYLPLFVLRIALWFIAKLDSWNLLPKTAIDNDPMYASLFVANLGSVGLNDTFHHLYEYGNTSIFAVMGPVMKTPMVTRHGALEVRDGLQARYTFDERIADGFMSFDGLSLVKKVMENPEKYLGMPAAVADAKKAENMPSPEGKSGDKKVDAA